MRTGVANLPLHGGKAPAWLFGRMVRLAGPVVEAIVLEQGPDEVLRRLSDPFWFQAFGCLLGFDWHSSGVTTTVTGAVKEGLRGRERELGLHVCGGKGKTSRRTPDEIRAKCEPGGIDGDALVYASRMSAKVDSSAVQDGYQIYHHAFAFTDRGTWAVVQQGMDEGSGTARRYHWLGEGVKDFVEEPQAAICCDRREGEVLDMTARESRGSRDASTAMAKLSPAEWERELSRIAVLDLPARHEVLKEDISSRYLHKILLSTYEAQPAGFESLLGLRGVGPKTVRALALLGELLAGETPSFRDPARFSFAHGGKDGHPYPVDRATYDRTIETLGQALDAAKAGDKDKLEALRRLKHFHEERHSSPLGPDR